MRGDHAVVESVVPTETTTRQALMATLRDLPPRVRLQLVVGCALLATVTAIGVVDLWVSVRPSARFQLAGLIAGNAGLLVLMVIVVLHQASQREVGGACARPFAFRTTVLHQMLLPLPVLGLLAASLLTAGCALSMPAVVDGRWRVIFSGVYLIYAVWAGRTVSDSSRFLYRYAHEQAAAAERARSEAAEARLTALQAQMNPHFLFNALNTVAALARSDPAGAEETAENLADVLRTTMERSDRLLTSLGDEVEYLRAYLAIEERRFADRLAVHWTLGEGTDSLRLPPMTLQPLVENALRHGVGADLDGGGLRIAATADRGVLVIEVSDDGPGFPSGWREGTGIGNLRRRLATLYGETASLTVANGDGSHAGASVVVRVPQAEPSL